jgi:predicted dehydrogenase
VSGHDTPVRLAVVGCGAAAGLLHLPALSRRRDCEVVAVIDPDRGRAQRLARRFGVPRVLTDHREVADTGATAAVLAAPNDLHAALTIDLVEMGLDVLVEKPVALTVADADAMAAAAARAGAVVGVGMLLRFAAANRTAKSLIDQGVLGAVQSFTIDAGVEYAWPVSTG